MKYWPSTTALRRHHLLLCEARVTLGSQLARCVIEAEDKKKPEESTQVQSWKKYDERHIIIVYQPNEPNPSIQKEAVAGTILSSINQKNSNQLTNMKSSMREPTQQRISLQLTSMAPPTLKITWFSTSSTNMRREIGSSRNGWKFTDGGDTAAHTKWSTEAV